MSTNSFLALLRSFTVVEYSAKQKCWHVDDLPRSLANNYRAIANGHAPDYVPVGIFPTREAAYLWLDEERDSGRLPRSGESVPVVAGPRVHSARESVAQLLEELTGPSKDPP